MAFELPVPAYTRLDAANMRTAGRDLLALALMDARNHSLFLVEQHQQARAAPGSQGADAPSEPGSPPWVLGHVGWFQERWIGRNLQRHQGPRCDPLAAPLASQMAQADFWWDDRRAPSPPAPWTDMPGLDELRPYLLNTLEATLDLLNKTPDEDAALYFYRLALFHEDMHSEALLQSAQAQGVRLQLPLPQPAVLRAPLVFSTMRWRLGLEQGGGFTFDNERPACEVGASEFEIDAQPVVWAQYLDFVMDGGYDRPELWLPAGWDWLQQQVQREGKCAPRYVRQMGVARLGAAGAGAVVQQWFGQTVRLANTAPVVHVSWWEADAWCRWAGRRLPGEVEWEIAAHQGAARGFRWGEVWEWTASTFDAYPGFRADPWREYSEPFFGARQVLRGASVATRRSLKSPKFRNFQRRECDDAFCGFRSCAL